MQRKKYLGVLVLFIALVIQPALALTSTQYTIETEWGDTQAGWARFGYVENENLNLTPLYWYRDFIYQNVSKISIKEDYNEVNIMYRTLINETESWIEISRTIKEYRHKPFTEVTVTTRCDNELAIAFPNFATVAKGQIFLAPGVAEPRITKIGDGTDEKWPAVISPEDAANLEDNYALIYTRGEKSTLLITNKRFYGMTSWDKGDYWEWYFAMWAFDNLQPDKNYTYKYWLAPVYITEKDITMERIKAKASDLAREALVKPVKLHEEKTKGHDYWLYEVWYTFEYETNDWGLNPLECSPHNAKGEMVNASCLAAIYLPKNAIAVKGEEGYPAVFRSGEPAVGLYFKDSINGARGNDLWFGEENESAGGGFYLKKFESAEEIVKVHYIVPVETPGLNITGQTKLIIAGESYLNFSKTVFYISLALLTIALLVSLYVVIRRKTFLMTAIILYLAAAYFLYHFYMNPLRTHNIAITMLLSASLVLSTLTYKTGTGSITKFYLALLSVSIIFTAALALFNFTGYMGPLVLVIPASVILTEGLEGVSIEHE